MDSWVFLLVGSFAATGAAMALGTIAALVRYRRTGEFPGVDGGNPPPRRIGWLWVRIVVGLGIAILGITSLVNRGLL